MGSKVRALILSSWNVGSKVELRAQTPGSTKAVASEIRHFLGFVSSISRTNA